jgi:hypothetical protein
MGKISVGTRTNTESIGHAKILAIKQKVKQQVTVSFLIIIAKVHKSK